MHPFRVVRRLLSRAREDWQDAVDGLFTPQPARRPLGPRPLRVMRLERRRVLSADFSLTATGLVLSGFDDAGGDTLTVQQEEDAYQFTSANGWEQHEPGQLPTGVTIDGDTLSVDRAVLEGLEDGLTIEGSLGHQLDVRLGDADFSGLSGPVTLAGASTVGQDQPFALFTAPTDGFQLIVAPAGTVLTSINVSGDLNILSIGGSITDAPGSEIIISGNATFTSRALSPAGDFNGDGVVNDVDRTDHWSKNYGMTSGATKYDGDANGDGRVDAADYSLWRDTVGQTGRGGIQLADNAGDRLVIGGSATFDAAEPEGTHDIYVGVGVDSDGKVINEGGRAEFGSLNAYGANVVIHEDTTVGASGPTTVIGDIQAHTLVLQSAGKIEAGAGSEVLIESVATLTSKYAEAGGGVTDLSGGVYLVGRFEAGGLVTLIAQDDGGDRFDIEVADAATAHFGSLSATGAVVTIYEDGGTFKPQRDGSQAGTLISGIDAQQLWIDSAGPITDTVGATIEVGGDATFVVSDAAVIADGSLVQAIVLADGPGANQVEIDGTATFIVEHPATLDVGFTGPKGVDVGVVPNGQPAGWTFNAGSLRFHAPGATVRIAEDSGTVLAGWGMGDSYTASVTHTLQVHSTGDIRDAAEAVVRITGRAADGSLVEDPTASAAFYAGGRIVLADEGAANELSIDGLSTFIARNTVASIDVGVTSVGAAAAATFNTGSLRFQSLSGPTRIAEDSNTVLVGWTSVTAPPVFPVIPTSNSVLSLELVSAGSITDEADFNLVVGGARVLPPFGHATFVAKDEIVLGDGATGANSIAISNIATFVSTDGDDISVGVTSGGVQAPAFFNAGSIRFVAVGGDVRIAEDSPMTLAGWEPSSIAPSVPLPAPSSSVAENLELFSTALIDDEANAVLEITGNATFVGGGIVLADGSTNPDGPPTTNAIRIGGVATFVGGWGSTVRVGTVQNGSASPAVFQAGSLRFYAPNGTVRIAEDDGTHFADWMSTPVSPLIATPPMSTEALNIHVYSAGSITDADGAVTFATSRTSAGIRVYNPSASATFVAAESITLADGGADNKLMVDGALTLVSTAASGQQIDVGVSPSGGIAGAEFIAGNVRFWAEDGAVRLAEDIAVNFKGATYSEANGTVIGAWPAGPVSPIIPSAVDSNRAGTLQIVSFGPITDAENAFVEVTGDAGFRVIGTAFDGPNDKSIRLADSGAGNTLRIDGAATFVVDGGRGIDVGVTAAGGIAAAEFNAGSVRFNTTGAVRIAEDSATHLDGWNSLTVGLIRPEASMNRSLAGSLELYSAGSITDADLAYVQVNDAATLAAAEDITLVDAGVTNVLVVEGLATFVVGYGRALNVGVTWTGQAGPSVFRAGSLRFSAPNGTARVAENNGMLLAGWPMGSTSTLLGPAPPMATEAKTIEVYSSSITDTADAVVLATGRDSGGARVYDPTASATFVASGSITLADGGSGNKLIIDGGATFVSILGAPINVGVTDAGAMAAAEFVAGSVRFSTQGGAVRIVEDAVANFKNVVYAETPGTVLSGWAAGTISPLVPPGVDRSVAGSLELVSNGPITDAANAVVEVAGAAGFRVLGALLPADGHSIRLADAGGDNRLAVGGAATFVVDGARGIDVGVTPTGTPASAQFDAGSLRFWSTDGGSVRIAEDSATQLAGWNDIAVGLIRPALSTNFNHAATLELLSTGAITDAADMQLRVNDDATFISTGASDSWAIALADSGETNRILIGDLATFIVTAPNANLRVGVTASATTAEAGFNAGRIRFSAPTGNVQIAEDASVTVGGAMSTSLRGTLLAGWTTDSVSPLLTTPAPTMSQADSLAIVSNGPITDALDAIIDVTNDASFLVSAQTVRPVDKVIILADDNATGSINRLTVGGYATFSTIADGGIDVGVTSAGAPAEATFNAGALRFNAPDFQVRIAEDSGTSLAKGTANSVLGVGGPITISRAGSLQLTSNGIISDEATTNVEISGDATFTVSSIVNVNDDRAIVLANRESDGNKLSIGGLAQFRVVQEPSGLAPKGIDVGVSSTGTAAGAIFWAGSLAFDAAGAAVRIAEDNGTLLAGLLSQAGSLDLYSAGSITDAISANVQVTGDATLVAAQGIQIADIFASNQIDIDGLATFVVGRNQTLAVGTQATGPAADAAFNAGSLRFYAANGTARIAEDSGTELAPWMDTAVSPLIAAPPMATEAKTIEIWSGGSITDSPTAVIIATGNSGGARVYDQTANATFVAAESITLADGDADNKLIVDGRLTLVSTTGVSQQIDVGVTGAGAMAGAEFVAGSVRVSAPGDDMAPGGPVPGGAVRIGEDVTAAYKGVTYDETPGTVIADWTTGTISGLIESSLVRSEAASLEVTSAGAITDTSDAKVDVTGDATFTVNTIANVGGARAIELANGDAANELIVDGHARFVVIQVPTDLTPKGIDVGVIASGAPADALFSAGTLGFSAQGGLVRMAEDNDTVLGGASEAHDLELLSAGSITDTVGSEAAPTSVEVTQSALLKAGLNGQNDVALGAGATAKFSMLDREGKDPDLFSNDQYLAVQARNVSIHADSGINIRTGDAALSNLDNYSQFAGTYYVTAKGSVTQSTTATPKALAADKISVASDNGAVLLRLVKPTGVGTDPNLQIKAGGSVALTQIVSDATVKSRFADSDIPSTDNSKFAPVIVEADDPTTGVRSGVATRPGVNNVFEDLYAGDSTGVYNARVSEAVLDANRNPVRDALGNLVYDHAIPDGSGGVRTIDDFYAVVVIVDGAAVVGDVHDPNAGDRQQADTADGRGVVVDDAGNAFIATLNGGNLLFTNRNREGGDVLDGIAVQMAGGVFTAVAAGTLRIDTEEPDSLADNLRTTRLVSKTGTVTNVDAGKDYGFGPRAILDSPTEEANAATTGLIRADQDFEQRITMALGSRGEDNILVEVEWADVADIRESSNANVRLAADPNLDPNMVDDNGIPGSQQYADLVQAPRDAIEEKGRNLDYEYQLSADKTRVATITHNYETEFVPSNPAQNRLPTTVRVFNDSSINLFDQNVGNDSFRNLNSVSFAIAPRIITLPPPGFFIISQPELPQRYEPVSVTLPAPEPSQPAQMTAGDNDRAVAVSSAEDVLYGRVDDKGEWITDIPGETWPRVHEDAEGDFLREIRDKIDEGPYSKGRYVIKVVTPRSEQLLEEWVKGDTTEADEETAAKPAELEGDEEAAGKAAEEAAAPADEALLEDGATPGVSVIDGPVEMAPAAAPLGAPLGLMELESATGEARNAAFAAMAAVGGWRRRLNDAGPFTLDADGVAFTRVRRQRRKRSSE